MYKNTSSEPKMANLPYFLDSTLNTDNRWVKLAGLIPWSDVEEIYALNFTSKKGPKAISARTAFGALIIQVKLSLTDEETIETISENPYMQYFIGLEIYEQKAPFDSSMMTHFRKRFNAQGIKDIDELLHSTTREKSIVSNDDSDDDPPSHKGAIIVDASCVPADIHYPTDLGLLNKAREKTEEIIDILWSNRSNVDEKVKPRTYREDGRKSFLSIVLQKRATKKKRRQALDKQLNSVRRNLKSINELKNNAELSLLKSSLYRDLLVIGTLYQQQQYMYDNKVKSVDDRIVSIHQPHIRPIVRGKAGAHTEFGAKISISVVDGWSFLDTINFDAYNEGTELISQIEQYKARFGYYPESAHADKIYRNKVNRAYCKKHGIRISGPCLGRPPKDVKLRQEQKDIQRQDEAVRNAVEGRFGVGKRRYKLDRILTKIKGSSKTLIALVFMVMNLEKAMALATLISLRLVNVFYEIISGIERRCQIVLFKTLIIQ
jgi:transposase, IS5 family